MFKKLIELIKDNKDAVHLLKQYKNYKDEEIDELENDRDNLLTQFMILKTQYIQQIQITLKDKEKSKKLNILPVNVEVDPYLQQTKEREILKNRINDDIKKEVTIASIEGLLNSYLELSARQIQVHLNKIDKINNEISSIENAVKKYSETTTT